MKLTRGLLFCIIAWSVVAATACSNMVPTSPSSVYPALSVTPANNQVWVQTNPFFTASGGDGTYRWEADHGNDGLIIPMGPNLSQVEFRPNKPGPFKIYLSSGGQTYIVTGVVQ